MMVMITMMTTIAMILIDGDKLDDSELSLLADAIQTVYNTAIEVEHSLCDL
jgi:hypothetical protein